MIKVSVVSTKDIWKYFIKFIIVIICVIFLLKMYEISKRYFGDKELSAEKCISYITEEITAMESSNSLAGLEINPTNIIGGELRMSQSVTSRGNSGLELQDPVIAQDGDEQTHTQEDVEAEKSEDVQEVSTNVQTQVIETGYKNTYNIKINGVQIKNETDYDLTTIGLSGDITVNNKNILIFHTHTCESYTKTAANSYESSGNYRTTDLNYSVSRVADELQKYLNSAGYNVIHDKTYHDYPSYSGSYGRSLKTVSNLLQQNPGTDVVIDLHRDAIGDESYAPKIKIGDEYAAQVMFVIGTNGSGLTHENWKQNLEFAIKVQQKANEMYPGLFKPILLRNARYNQHLSKAATIIEVGATGNTLEECEVSAKYLSKVLDEVLK